MQKLKRQHLNGMSLAGVMVCAERMGVSHCEAETHYNDASSDEVYRNKRYLVIVRDAPTDLNPTGVPGIKWLSIRRIDGKTVRDWKDLQDIKNQLLGPGAEAIEVFPAESRKVDAVNQYHLFGGPGWVAPFGFPRS